MKISEIRCQYDIKGELSRLKTIFGSWKSFKDDEKRFLFHFKSSFYSQDI